MRKVAGRDEQRDRLKRMEAARKKFEEVGLKPASLVMRKVRARSTIFVGVDHATGVGGFPLERFGLIHGPSGEGKTAFAIGLAGSFLRVDDPVLYADAECTTPIDWPRRMIGGLADHPFFFAERPDIYEELMELNRSFLHKVDELRLGKLLAEDASALVVVDSLRKLVPRNIAKAVEDSVLKHGADGVGGRSGQVRAAMNAAWMDELVPLLDKTRTAFVAIARESEDPDADAFMRARGHAYKVGGGKAIYYDASMVFRVERESYVTKPTDKEKKEAPVVYGERHRVTIRKTKVAGHEDKYTVGYFHTSNGRLVPFGYDRARDLLELGERFGVVEKSGAWYSFGGERIAQGRDNVVVNLTANRPMMDAIELAVRARFADNPVEEHDADGVVA